MKNIVIGIEGLVGAGKTSICRELLKKIPNSILLHGGNLYRAIVYALMNYRSNNMWAWFWKCWYKRNNGQIKSGSEFRK